MTAEEKATQREIDRVQPVEDYIRTVLTPENSLTDQERTLIAGNLRAFWSTMLAIGGRIELEGWGPGRPAFDIVRVSPYKVSIDGIRCDADILRLMLVTPKPERWMRLERREDDVVVATTMVDGPEGEFAQEMLSELERARRHGDRFASLHEGYAVILEELDEIWEITRQKRRERNGEELRKEFVQLGAMALKALLSLENFTGGNE